MAKGEMKIFLLATAIMAASFWTPATGQINCMTALFSLLPCLNYISGSSSTPSSSCCSPLASIVQSQPQCLCMVVNGEGPIAGISINKTQALALPSACNVQTPPVGQCNAGTGGSSGSPPESPQAAPNTPTTPSTPSTPSTQSTPSTPSNPSTQSTPSNQSIPSTAPEAPSSPIDTASTPAATGSSSGNGSKSTNGDSSDGRMNKSVMSIVFCALIFGSSLASFF